jgi:DNA polymerase III epsilon subunit-like protein
MRKHNLAFIDIETTGLDFIKHEIIEIGCVVTTPNLEIIEKFELKIKPENIENADPVSLKVNHYDSTKWEDAQNVSFDSEFLDSAFLKIKSKNTMHYHKLDTISIAWAKLHNKPEITHFSLRELCKHFDIKNENAHHALSDAHATFELYKKLIEL